MELHSIKEQYRMNTAPAEPLAENEVYFISRQEFFANNKYNDKYTIIWYGYNTNWKFEDGEWSMLLSWNEGFKPCEEPVYEKMRRELHEKI